MSVLKKVSNMGLLQDIFKKTDYRCGYCGKEILWNELTIDHINPISRGGSLELSNLMASCKHCNSQKGTKSLEEYRYFFRNPLKFTTAQIEWLESQGFSVEFPDYKFYFEGGMV